MPKIICSYDKLLIKLSRVINFQLICVVKFERFVFFYGIPNNVSFENYHIGFMNITKTTNKSWIHFNKLIITRLIIDSPSTKLQQSRNAQTTKFTKHPANPIAKHPHNTSRKTTIWFYAIFMHREQQGLFESDDIESPTITFAHQKAPVRKMKMKRSAFSSSIFPVIWKFGNFCYVKKCRSDPVLSCRLSRFFCFRFRSFNDDGRFVCASLKCWIFNETCRWLAKVHFFKSIRNVFLFGKFICIWLSHDWFVLILIFDLSLTD